ncbi:MAG: hypothetical protein NZ954_09045 [Thermofilaceae archaeon]|nr:hypothetical protein [Thermofilaceae archaeon]
MHPAIEVKLIGVTSIALGFFQFFPSCISVCHQRRRNASAVQTFNSFPVASGPRYRETGEDLYAFNSFPVASKSSSDSIIEKWFIAFNSFPVASQ